MLASFNNRHFIAGTAKLEFCPVDNIVALVAMQPNQTITTLKVEHINPIEHTTYSVSGEAFYHYSLSKQDKKKINNLKNLELSFNS